MRYQSVFRADLFHGQAVVVTGGGSGIGRCTAHELSALGASVALVGRNPNNLEQVVQEITQAGGSASLHVCDIREEEQVEAAIARAVAPQAPDAQRHGLTDLDQLFLDVRRARSSAASRDRTRR